jgi:hypothetical protein
LGSGTNPDSSLTKAQIQLSGPQLRRSRLGHH